MKKKIIIIMVLVALIPIVMTGGYFYNVVSSILYARINDKIDAFTNNTNSLIYSRMEDINNTFFIIMNDETINKLYSLNPQNDPTVDSQIKNTIDKKMDGYLNFNYVWKIGIIEQVALYNRDGNYYHRERQSYSIGKPGDINEVYGDYKAKNGKFELVPHNGAIYYLRDFNDVNTGTLSGTLVFAINEGILTKEYSEVMNYEGAQVIIYSADGVIISHTDKRFLGEKISDEYMEIGKSVTVRDVEIDGEKYLAAVNHIDTYRLNSLILIPVRSAYSDMPGNIANYMLIIIPILVVTLIIGILLSITSTKHINELVESMEKVQGGDYTVRMRSYKEKELFTLSSIFNNMINHISHLINEVYNNQILLKEAEMKTLQAQINPHFLFNVLFCIGSKAKMSDNETVYKMISSLSELMQASIYTDSNAKTTIEQELKHVEFYLYLQKERFADRLDIDMSGIDQSVMGLYIPKFCIQTLVENAIVHGLENKMGNGRLVIKAYKQEDSVCFDIMDDGVGFDIGGIDLDGDPSLTATKKSHTNIGLINTQKRLRLLYGDGYGITLQSVKGSGTKVSVRIPADRGDDTCSR